MSEAVLDASSLLALVNQEPGHEEVARTIPDAAISAVNLAEVAAKLAEGGMPEESIREALEGLAIDVHDFGRETGLPNRDAAPPDKAQGPLVGGPGVPGAWTTAQSPRHYRRPSLERTRSRGGGQAGKVLVALW